MTLFRGRAPILELSLSLDSGARKDLRRILEQAKWSYRQDRTPSVAPTARGLVNLDSEGHVIENFGLPGNLMIVHALEAFGRPTMVPDEEPADIWRDLALFEKYVAWIARQQPGAKLSP